MRRSRFALQILLLIMITLVAWPAAARADEPDTRELRTKYFSIQYSPSDYRGAEWYAGVVDAVYEDITDLFDYRPATPITFRLLPTIESYVRANPVGVNPGVLAHINTRDRELGVASPRLAAVGGQLATDTIRHELTHLIASELTGGRLPIGFHEGLAQYVERDHVEREALIETLRRARDANKLLSWESWNTRGRFYSDIDTGYAQSYAILAFLADQPEGLRAFRRFLHLQGAGQDWPAALEQAYGKSVTTLETEWRAALPAFLDGGWRTNALAAWDLAPSLKLLAAGDYAAAEDGLQRSLRLYEMLERPAQADRARAALEQARAGRQAGEALARADELLGANEFTAAEDAFSQAAALYERSGDASRAEAARQGREIALAGRAGQDHLARARAALDAGQYLAARSEAAQAASDLSRAGDQARRAEAERIWHEAAVVQRNLGLAALGAGAGLLAILALRRRRRPRPAWLAQLTAESPGPAL